MTKQDRLRNSPIPLKYWETRGIDDAFSRCHTIPYSVTALQEMNLAYFYPPIYWQTACLTVNASAVEEDESKGATNYGKTAIAISRINKRSNIRIALPDINLAGTGFTPDEEHDRILFGLKAICGIGDDDVSTILAYRPYASLEDFLARTQLPRAKNITLIKAGCFDNFLTVTSSFRESREDLLQGYILSEARKECPPKEKLTMTTFKQMHQLRMIPSRYDFLRRLAVYRDYIRRLARDDKYVLDPAAGIFFDNELIDLMEEGREYCYQDGRPCLYIKPFEKWYTKQVSPLKDFLADPEIIEQYNKTMVLNAANILWEKYCKRGASKWEMDTLSFYYSGHELLPIPTKQYQITPWEEIPAEPQEKQEGKPGPELYRIWGTVLDKNKIRHTITFLTPWGVVNVKYYAAAFASLDKELRVTDGAGGTKTDPSWFARGTLLLLTGIRRGDTFFPRVYRGSVYPAHTTLIEDICGSKLTLRTTRLEG